MKKELTTDWSNQIKINHQLFCKKTTPTTDYFIDRKNEKAFYEQTQEVEFIKIPFQMRQTWTGHWISKMTYYPQAQTLAQKKYNLPIYQAVKKLIENLQTLNLELKTFQPQAFLDLFIKKVGTITELEPLSEQVQKIIFHYYNHSKKLVVAHNDLIADNFLILEEKLYLIDFEYVSYNHPLFDYASFLTEACTEKQAKEFLQILNLNQQQTQELQELMLYQNYLWAHWAKYMFRETKKPVYQKIEQTKIQQALKLSSVFKKKPSVN